MSVFVSVSHRSHYKEVGQVLVLGQGDVGQLGLGESITERKKPALVSLPEKIVQVVAGGMHTVCLSETGQVSGNFFLYIKVSLNEKPYVSHIKCLHVFRSTLLAVTMRELLDGTRQKKDPRRFHRRLLWTRRWSRCLPGTATQRHSQRMDQCLSGAPSGLVNCCFLIEMKFKQTFGKYKELILQLVFLSDTHFFCCSFLGQ